MNTNLALFPFLELSSDSDRYGLLAVKYIVRVDSSFFVVQTNVFI